jgi:ferredoxin
MKKVRIAPGCTTCGLCEFLAPEVFQVTDVSHVKPDAPIDQYEKDIKQAVTDCPVQVIIYEDETDDAVL